MIERFACRAASERGTALLFALTVTSLLILLATSLSVLVRASTMVEGLHSDTTQSFYHAEAGINQGNAEFKNIFLGFNVPTGNDFNARNSTIAGNAVRYQLSAVAGYPKNVRILAGQNLAGLNSQDFLYVNQSQALAPDGSIKAQLGSRTLIRNIPLFQFLAFYDGDLEIQPAPLMTLHGRVHTNANLYLNSSGNTLSIIDEPLTANPRLITTVEVSAVQNIYRKRKDDNTCSGTVTIDTLVTNPATGDLTPRNLGCNGGAALTAGDVAPWLGSLSNGASGAKRIETPPTSATTRMSFGPLDYWPKADLRIVLDLTPARDVKIGQTLLLQAPPVLPTLDATQVANSPSLHVIEVQNSNGTRDDAKTTLLWKFMYANPGKIFYNDVPNVALGTCYSACAQVPGNYNPPFKDRGTAPVSDVNMIYRRADDPVDPNGKWYQATTTGAQRGSNRLDYRRGAFFNNREKRILNAATKATPQGTFMYLLNIDVEELMAWNLLQPANARLFDPADRTEGGIVIFASIIGQGTNPVPALPQATNFGVRVFDSAVLPFPAGITNSAEPTGLTVVSDQAIYVEGNYNVNGPLANPTWNPAAFIGDTLNVLSQNWEAGANDGKSLLPLDNRDAATTEINAAFIASVDLTTPNNGNGGFENYPRMHEDWDGPNATLRYRGSFVSLATPRFSNGPWCLNGQSCDITGANCTGKPNCNIYTPPIRDWDYDGRFESAANLPPLNPRVVLAEQQLFDEQFE